MEGSWHRYRRFESIYPIICRTWKAEIEIVYSCKLACPAQTVVTSSMEVNRRKTWNSLPRTSLLLLTFKFDCGTIKDTPIAHPIVQRHLLMAWYTWDLKRSIRPIKLSNSNFISIGRQQALIVWAKVHSWNSSNMTIENLHAILIKIGTFFGVESDGLHCEFFLARNRCSSQ